MNNVARSDHPLVSVIVPTWNSASIMGEALESLARQTWRDFEVVVSDGASSDATVSLAGSFADRLPALTIDSRNDRGVYDAINRGVRSSRGTWFLVLGSDDRLHATDTLAVAASELEGDAQASMVYGDVRLMATGKSGAAGQRYAGPMPLQRLLTTNVCQQAIFYRRAVFDRLGGFDLRYRLYADWHFNIMASFDGPTRWIDLVVADYAATGMSSMATDAEFLKDQPHMIRAELLRRVEDRSTWRLHGHLLRCANRYRRRSEWRNALAFIGGYMSLLGRRLPLLIRQPATPRSH